MTRTKTLKTKVQATPLHNMQGFATSILVPLVAQDRPRRAYQEVVASVLRSAARAGERQRGEENGIDLYCV